MNKVPERLLSGTGPHCSGLIQGCWRLADWGMSREDLADFLLRDIDLGITTFDHADIYGDYRCESLFGEAAAGIDRDTIQLVGKCGIKLVSEQRPGHRVHSYDTSRGHIVASVERSLANLRTTHLDLLLIHRPDPLLDPAEVAEAFTELHDAGKVRSFGVSNFTPAQFDLLSDVLPMPLVTNQIEYSIMNMATGEDGTLDHLQRVGVTPMAWSPLGGGELFREDTGKGRRLRSVLSEIGDAHRGAALEQVALAWILRHPARMIPVIGTGKPERVERAVEAFQIELTREEWFMIWTASAGHDVP